MSFWLTLKNYRCFPDSHPARLFIGPGFTALLGPNNSVTNGSSYNLSNVGSGLAHLVLVLGSLAMRNQRPAVLLIDEPELSFRSFRDLGFDGVLLVEGPSEVKVFQQFLRKLKAESKFLLLPLGGSSLINARCGEQLEEIKKITSNIFAVVDSERADANEALTQDRCHAERRCSAHTR